MTLHPGPSYTSGAVSLVAPDAVAVRRARLASDVAGAAARWLAQASAGDRAYYFSVTWAGRLVGQIFLHDIDRAAGEALVGYHLFRPRFRGHGVGTAALRLLQRFVTTETELRRLVVITGDANRASRRVAEKCGFVPAGAPREDPAHGVVYEWLVPDRRAAGAPVGGQRPVPGRAADGLAS